VLFPLVLLAAGLPLARAQSLDPSLYGDLRWRSIGPHRGGWSTCAAGIPDEPNVFYFGAADGGMWKTEDAGETWTPLFQHESSATVGAFAIAPSNPKILYVGTGHPEPRYDVASGDGVFRSDDGGVTWRHVGLEATRAIGRILIGSRNPDVVLVAALGRLFGPNPERGVFRSEDGGRTWSRTLFVDADTGAVDLAASPEDPSVVYAAVWHARVHPWLSYFEPIVGATSGVYKSTDGGRSWKRLSGGGWPEGPLGRIGLETAPGGRVYALVDAQPFLSALPAGAAAARKSAGGLYRSDDAGATWKLVNGDPTLGGWYFARLTVEPGNRDVIYVMGQSVKRSDDAGKTFDIVKGAPGGDDYHFLWINPKHSEQRVLASDQGTVVSVNGGRSWSSWYNQPTGQFYHVETDARFPYWVYSGQQDSGTVGIASRGDYGAVSYREWHPVGGEERGWDVPDPADPEIVYGTGLGGTVTRFDGRTGQVENVSPWPESTYGRRPTETRYRYTWISPLAISRKPPHAMYVGSQVVFRSTDRGKRWEAVSPDLTGAVPGTKGCDAEITVALAKPCGFGVVFSLALSPHDEREIWAGTDDGLVHVTRDGGKTWSDVTPRGLPPWEIVASLDVSALEPGVVYAAVDGHRKDDSEPHAWRTRDGGKTWTSISAGLPAGHFLSVVRADPVRKGLLYAGTDTGVFVSFDDGGRWQPLQQNLPTTWVRDLTVHGADLVAATQGRGIWVLDDVTPLRAISAETAAAAVELFAPSPAVRVRRSENKDTPLPPETPLGRNPPAGAVLDYWIGSETGGPVTLEIRDAKGDVVRRFSSADPPEAPNASRYFARAWVPPKPGLPTARGHHRFVWDLRYPLPKVERFNYSIAAIWGEGTPLQPEGPLAVPGEYSVKLTAGDRTVTRTLRVEKDPRVPASAADFSEQLRVARAICAELEKDDAALREVRSLRARLAKARSAAGDPSLAKALSDLDARAAEIETGRRGTPDAASQGLSPLNGRLASLLDAVESADTSPTSPAAAMFEDLQRALAARLEAWKALQRDLPPLEAKLPRAESDPAGESPPTGGEP